MAAYTQKANKLSDRIKDLASRFNWSDEELLEATKLVVSGAKAMPWRGATFKVKSSFAQELVRNIESLKTRTEQRESRDGGTYEAVVIEVKDHVEQVFGD